MKEHSLGKITGPKRPAQEGRSALDLAKARNPAKAAICRGKERKVGGLKFVRWMLGKSCDLIRVGACSRVQNLGVISTVGEEKKHMNCVDLLRQATGQPTSQNAAQHTSRHPRSDGQGRALHVLHRLFPRCSNRP